MSCVEYGGPWLPCSASKPRKAAISATNELQGYCGFHLELLDPTIYLLVDVSLVQAYQSRSDGLLLLDRVDRPRMSSVEGG